MSTQSILHLSLYQSLQTKRSRRRCGKRFPRIEGLEDRRLLSGATVYTVNSTSSHKSGTGDAGTLPYVIGLANTDPNPAGSEIEFDPTVFDSATPSTITLACTLELSETSGPMLIDGPGANVVTVSGDNAVGVFLVDSGVTATLTGLTISDGAATAANSTGNGGGICNSGNLTVQGCTLTDNDAEANGGGIFNSGTLDVIGGTLTDNHAFEILSGGDGGGICNSGGNMQISDGCEISSNYASSMGGGIYQSGGTAQISGGCRILSNLAVSSGGGIWSNSTLKITNCDVGGNTVQSGNGGGLFASGGTASVSLCAFSNNAAGPGETNSAGGGIYVNGGSLTLIESTLSNNTADGFGHDDSAAGGGGGGLFDHYGNVHVSDCGITSNLARGNGGGIFEAGGTMVLSDDTINNNIATHAGGGVYVRCGTLTIENSTLDANSAVSDGGSTGTSDSFSGDGSGSGDSSGQSPSSSATGGAIFNRRGKVAIQNCQISDNLAQSSGGGIVNEGGTMTVSDATINCNSTNGYGGGVYVMSGSLTIANSTLSANSAGENGGGVANSGAITIINSTITKNSALSGAGIWTDGVLTAVNATIVRNESGGSGGAGLNSDSEESDGTSTFLDNTIVALNTESTESAIIASDIAGTVSGSYNLIGSGGSGGLTDTNGNQVGVTDPLLGNLAENGGATETVALLPGSPAIGAGSDNIEEIAVPSTDQRGVARPSDSIDIGAFQDQGFTVIILGDGSSQSTTVNTSFADALSVEVSSAAGDPVMGGVVTFLIRSNGASADLSAVTVPISCRGDAASVTAIANSLAGSYEVTATTTGAVTPAAFSLTNRPLAVSVVGTTTKLTVSGSPSTFGQVVSFTAIVSAPNAPGAPAGTVLFTIDGQSEPLVNLVMVNGTDQAVFSTTKLAAGTHTITVTYSGDSNFASSSSSSTAQVIDPPTPSATLPTPVSVDGPAVASVLRYGYHMKPTVLVLTFDQALDAVSAENGKNYRIIGPDGKRIGVKSVVYDPATRAVTLRPKTRISIHHTYKLIVDGSTPHGVINTAGLLLDGADAGHADGDYRTSLTWRNLVLDPPWPKVTRGSKTTTVIRKPKSGSSESVEH
jgi:Bacterial Ig-like domain (group 3)